jgi:putative acetyltransferase
MKTDPELSVRPYQPADLHAVIGIFLGAVREVAARDYSPAQIEAWARVDRDTWAVRRLSRPTWIAVIGQSPAGFTDLEPDGHLDMMFVHPAYQRIGVATALLQRVEAAARGQNLPRIFTDASITARPFFQSRGFQIVTQQVVNLRGQELTNFRMEKSVNKVAVSGI